MIGNEQIPAGPSGRVHGIEDLLATIDRARQGSCVPLDKRSVEGDRRVQDIRILGDVVHLSAVILQARANRLLNGGEYFRVGEAVTGAYEGEKRFDGSDRIVYNFLVQQDEPVLFVCVQ